MVSYLNEEKLRKEVQKMSQSFVSLVKKPLCIIIITRCIIIWRQSLIRIVTITIPFCWPLSLSKRRHWFFRYRFDPFCLLTGQPTSYPYPLWKFSGYLHKEDLLVDILYKNRDHKHQRSKDGGSRPGQSGAWFMENRWSCRIHWWPDKVCVDSCLQYLHGVCVCVPVNSLKCVCVQQIFADLNNNISLEATVLRERALELKKESIKV